MVLGAGSHSLIKFYSAWFCPFAQRTWITLNHLNLKYELIESLKLDETKNGYIKNEQLLAINPKGLVPTLDVDGEIVVESIDTIEYLHRHSENAKGDPNFVTAQLLKDAHWINENACSPFYRVLMKKDEFEQESAWKEFLSALKIFSESLHPTGFFKSESSMNIVDITIFPWINRLTVIEHFREKYLDKNLPWVQKLYFWYERMVSKEAVQKTVANKDNMLDIYQRYAEGTAKSKVGDAVRDGREAHDVD